MKPIVPRKPDFAVLRAHAANTFEHSSIDALEINYCIAHNLAIVAAAVIEGTFKGNTNKLSTLVETGATALGGALTPPPIPKPRPIQPQVIKKDVTVPDDFDDDDDEREVVI